jgi:hypothetical protein
MTSLSASSAHRDERTLLAVAEAVPCTPALRPRMRAAPQKRGRRANWPSLVGRPAFF